MNVWKDLVFFVVARRLKNGQPVPQANVFFWPGAAQVCHRQLGGNKFKDVFFEYDENNPVVLNGINLDIEGGKMSALVGLSGSGKSTIMNLIPRFYNVKSGDIEIDGQSINNVKIKSLRDKISLVSQDTTLFDDTIKNNIAYANLDASENEIIEAAKLSYCDEFIKELPQRYDTIIGENGIRLSGGEKQRISIARAMLKKSQEAEKP